MTVGIWVVGVVGSVVLLLVAGCAVVWITVEAVQRRVDRQIERGRELERAAIARSLLVQSWWFSESPPAMHVLQVHARALAGDCGFDPYRQRQEWRQLLKQERSAAGRQVVREPIR